MIHYIEYDPATGEGREIDPFKSPDLVAVVRCRDCKFYQPKEGAMLSCKFEYHSLTQWKLAEPDGFCAWGERRQP